MLELSRLPPPHGGESATALVPGTHSLSPTAGPPMGFPCSPRARSSCSPHSLAHPRLHVQVRALLIGSGFVEEPDALNAETADAAAVQAGLAALQALQTQRDAQSQEQRQALLEQRNVQHKTDRENREAMKAKIEDDATMRKEPGWKAQAAGSKDSSKSITSASDIGAQGGGG